MRFRSRSRATPWLNRGDQYRLLRLCGGLVVVLVLMQMAAESTLWSVFFPAGEPNNPPAAVPQEIDEGAFSVKGPSDLPPDTFRSEPEAGSVEAETEPQAEGSNLALPKGLLSKVEDNTLNVRPEEQPALRAILDRLRAADDAELAAAAEPGTFAVLMNETEGLRGELVTLRGEARRIGPYPADPADPAAFDVWMFLPDSGNNPVRVIAASIAAGLPAKGDLEEPVPVVTSGYLFKRQGYASRGGLHVAPLLIGKEVKPFSPPAAAEEAPAQIEALPWMIAGIFSLALGLAVLWRLSTPAWGERRQDRAAVRSEDTLESDLPTTTPEEFFEQLRREEIG